LFIGAVAAHAETPEQYTVDVRMIECERSQAGERTEPVIDTRLAGLAKDLSTLPFRSFVLKDAHSAVVNSGGSLSVQIPGPSKGKRFLVVAAHGRQAGGKLRFSLGIEAVRFDTLVAVPDGGTIIVGGPRADGGKVILFALTAKAKGR
jgi:hypothetical protein